MSARPGGRQGDSGVRAGGRPGALGEAALTEETDTVVFVSEDDEILILSYHGYSGLVRPGNRGGASAKPGSK